MATPVTSRPTAVDSSPLPALGDEKPDRDARRGQATKLSTAPSEATADQQDTSDSDEEALRGEKEVEVTANTQDKPRLRPRPRPRPRPILVPRPRPQPRLQPPADGSAPDTARPLPGAPAKHGTGSTETKGDGAEKQQQGASAAASRTAGAGSETAAADAGAHDKSRLLFRRNKNGPRKGGKQKEKGALGRAYEKVRLILPYPFPPDTPDMAAHLLGFENPSSIPQARLDTFEGRGSQLAVPSIYRGRASMRHDPEGQQLAVPDVTKCVSWSSIRSGPRWGLWFMCK